jgi:hypothetical protein
MIDYSALLYDPIFAVLGVPATLTVGVAAAVTITVVDDLKPKVEASGGLQTRGVEPGAFARMPELNARGIAINDCIGAVLAFNGRSWTVRNFDLIGNPNGEDAGEVRFLLKEAAVG